MIAYSQDRKIKEEVGYGVDNAICGAVHFVTYDCVVHTLEETIGLWFANMIHDEVRAAILRSEPK